MGLSTLTPEPLTKAAFRPFGDVIETEGAVVREINEGFARRFHDLANIDVAPEGGRAIVSIFRGRARPRPLSIGMLERHPLGSQAFFPLSPAPWLVVVALGTEQAPALETLRCFAARGDQGVNYARGVWHFPLLLCVPEQDFLIVDRGGSGDNLHEFQFPEGVRAQIDEGQPSR